VFLTNIPLFTIEWEGVKNRNKPEDLPELWILAFGYEKQKDSINSFYSDASRFDQPIRIEKIHSNCLLLRMSRQGILFFFEADYI
jgi:hypothetical protein